ncbi:MAG: hypothetical protein WAO75_02150, partial [Atribacterales bacterium]
IRERDPSISPSIVNFPPVILDKLFSEILNYYSGGYHVIPHPLVKKILENFKTIYSFSLFFFYLIVVMAVYTQFKVRSSRKRKCDPYYDKKRQSVANCYALP